MRISPVVTSNRLGQQGNFQDAVGFLRRAVAMEQIHGHSNAPVHAAVLNQVEALLEESNEA